MALTFIGFRGSGKSAVGAAVARRLGRPFSDADVQIESRAGRSIREIFATDGEPHFRELEQRVMAELLGGPDLVVAAGGGAVLSEATRDRMRRSGPVVYLRIRPETAEARIAADLTTADRRPALTTLPARSEIETLMSVREPLYAECATITLDADDLTVEQLAERVLAALAAASPEEAGP